MSMMTRIADALTGADIRCYLPGRHQGTCEEPYAVVTDAGIARIGKTTGRHVYYVTLYVPMEKPSMMTELLGTARCALLALTALRPNPMQSEGTIDEVGRAYCVSMEYSALCSA